MLQVAAEHWLADPIPLEGLIYSTLQPRDKMPTTVTDTVEAWHRILALHVGTVLYSPLLPLAYHPLLQEWGFRKLITRLNIATWGDLYSNGTFKLLEQMFPDNQPSPLDIFLYLRLRQGVPHISPALVLQAASPRHVVSRLYHTIHIQ